MTRAMIQAIDHAIGAHGRWKTRLRIALATGEGELDPHVIRRDDVCALGQWLHGFDHVARGDADYRLVCAVHAEFHRQAGRVLDLLGEGHRHEAANVMLGEFAECSDRLVRALTAWKDKLGPARQPSARTLLAEGAMLSW